MHEDVTQIGTRLLNEHAEQLTGLGSGVKDGLNLVTLGFKMARDAYDQHVSDVAELKSKADLVPQAGYMRLQREINEEAETNMAAGWRVADSGFAKLRTELTARALPKLSPEREQAGRQELALMLGDSRGESVRERLHTLALNGSSEALGAFFTPFGEALLHSRDVEPTEVMPGVTSMVMQRLAREGNEHAVAFDSLPRLEAIRSTIPVSPYR